MKNNMDISKNLNNDFNISNKFNKFAALKSDQAIKFLKYVLVLRDLTEYQS